MIHAFDRSRQGGVRFAHRFSFQFQAMGLMHPTVARKLIRELNQPAVLPPTPDPLTDREVKVLRLVAQGLSNDEIAQRLVVRERTVRTHVSNILEKLHLANRTQVEVHPRHRL